MQGLYEYGDILKKPVDVFRLGSGPEKNWNSEITGTIMPNFYYGNQEKER